MAVDGLNIIVLELDQRDRRRYQLALNSVHPGLVAQAEVALPGEGYKRVIEDPNYWDLVVADSITSGNEGLAIAGVLRR